MSLTPEEDYLWFCAQTWRSPRPPDEPHSIDWDRLVYIALHNRMQVLLEEVLQAVGIEQRLPPAAAQSLRAAASRYEGNAAKLGHDLRQYLHYAAEIDQQVVVMKGLWLSLKIYGQASMRPGGDIDVLLRREDIPASLEILEQQMGYGRWWRPLLDDRYYKRHHLHQQRCNHDRSIWFEPHWLLDHPFTRLTIDYGGLMDRTSPGELWGEPLREMAPPDLLISLAVHLVKHAVYLPYALHRPDLPRLILADGMLMYFVDVAEVLNHYAGRINWPQTVELAQQSGAVSILGSVLQVCRRFLDSQVPDEALEALALPHQGPVTTLVMNRLADDIIARFLGYEQSKLWAFLLGYQESAVFRPIRLLDLLQFLLPGPDYLQRRYGRASLGTAVRHFLGGSVRYGRVGFDTLYFSWKRKQEVRRLDEQGFVWPELPLEGEA